MFHGVCPHTVAFCPWKFFCQSIWHTMDKGWCYLHTNFTSSILSVELDANLILLCYQRLVFYGEITDKSIANYNKNQSVKRIHSTLMLCIIYPTRASLNLTWLLLIKTTSSMPNFLGLILSSLTQIFFGLQSHRFQISYCSNTVLGDKVSRSRNSVMPDCAKINYKGTRIRKTSGKSS